MGGLEQSHQTEHFNGFDLSMAARLPRAGTFNAGWSVGNTIQNTAISANGGLVNNASSNCFIVDNPEQLTSEVSPCDVSTPYQHRFRVSGSFELPWRGVIVAGVYQDLPGPLIVANRVYTSAEINRSRRVVSDVRCAPPREPSTSSSRSRCLAIGCVSSIFGGASCSEWATSGFNSTSTCTMR